MELSARGTPVRVYGSVARICATTRAQHSALHGSGSTVSEVMVNGPDDVYVERNGAGRERAYGEVSLL